MIRSPLIHWAVWAAAVAIAVALAVVRYRAALTAGQPDFEGFFLPAARAVASGRSPYSVDGYFYTPLVAVVLAPFAHVEWAAEAWTALRIAAGLGACVAATATASAIPWHRRGWVFAVAVVTLFWSWPATLELWAGQPNLLVLLALTLAALASSGGRPLASGVWLGIVVAVKSWTGLFLVWLLRRGAPDRLRSWIGVGVVGLVTVAGAVILGGGQAVRDMIFGPLSGSEQPLLAANSVWGVSRMLFSRTPVGEPLVVSPAAQTATIVCGLIVVIGLLIVLLRRPGAAPIALYNTAFLVILLLPVSHYFYLLLPLPALWWWLVETVRDPRDRMCWIAVAATLVWWVVCFRISPEGDGFMTTTWPSLLRVFTATLVAAAVSIICAAVRDRTRATDVAPTVEREIR